MYELDAQGHLPRRLQLTSKTELLDALGWWLSESKANTIGSTASFGGQPWVYSTVGDHRIHLNADTTRQAVEQVIAMHDQDPLVRWCVIENRRGRINKVVVGPLCAPLAGWFAYLDKPLSEAIVL